jgi:DNA (cytosine-5)-methyltransferase 1
MNGRSLSAVEIFAGGGGLAVGLREASFRTVAAVEVEPNAAATFKANHPEVQLFQQDVRTVTGKTLLKLAGGRVDVLAACPPCQGFSSLTSRWRRSDPRNELISEVARLAEEIKPRAVMVENVPGLIDKGKLLFDDLLSRLKALGYYCDWSVLQVADYGVPQKRRRLVLLAGLGFRIDMPKPTHSRTGAGDLPLWRTVGSAIRGLGRAVSLADSHKLGGPQNMNWHVVRQISAENKLRLRHAKPGAVWTKLPEEVRPPCHRGTYEGFTNVYGRMRWDEPSPTITAGCTTLSKGRFGHPTQNRTISLREAALLQTFPAQYHFETQHLERACEIVGNALPCVFAEAVAVEVAKALNAHSKELRGSRRRQDRPGGSPTSGAKANPPASSRTPKQLVRSSRNALAPRKPSCRV